MKLWFVIPTFNRCTVLRKCLDSLVVQDDPDFTIVVVNDGSSDDTAAMVQREFPVVTLVQRDGSAWWTGCMNAGLECVLPQANDDDVLVSFNDDVVAPPGYIAAMRTAAARRPRALIGSTVLDAANHHRPMSRVRRIDWRFARWNDLVMDSALPYAATDSLPGRGTLIPLAVFRTIGAYDARCFPQYFADEDFSIRAARRGFDLYLARDAVIYGRGDLTGLFRPGQSRSDFIKALFSMRSSIELKRRWRFIWRHAPWPWKPVAALRDMVAVISTFDRHKFGRRR